MKVTKEQFLAYEEVRQSGVTNMWAVTTVSDLSGLTKEVILMIMNGYSTYHKKFIKKG